MRKEISVLIELRDIRKYYDASGVRTKALDGISITIDKGEFVAIMGASGSGKSTLMNIIGAIDEATKGKYILSGKNVTALNNKELANIRNKEMGYIFQSFNLLEELTIIENVEMPLGYAGIRGKERKKRALELLEKVGLEGKKNAYPRQLSGGQQQRVAIARALINQPGLLLADEPTGNLDSTNGEEVMNQLVDLHKEGTTIILVTHDDKVASFADRRIEMKDGRVVNDEKLQ
ncbi:ABC transporter ATP-binding protein [Anaerosporobacter sp.]|uniref:ABC transporter ATP-binding protein n=1 Tax=Anaerosporobacter sp. TaxID=1872529 RepID=UPI002899B411|nr:ABC transporter ATP-binding protein [Anaerosporobacter sp.]